MALNHKLLKILIETQSPRVATAVLSQNNLKRNVLYFSVKKQVTTEPYTPRTVAIN